MSVLPIILEQHYPTQSHRHYPGSYWVSPYERALLHSLSNAGNLLRSQLSHLGDMERKSHIDKDGYFQVSLDVTHFDPKDISVKTENNSIVVHAKHEEKKDEQGFISREFTRRYELPKEFKVEDVTSSLSSDGVLTIKCAPAPAIQGSKVRQIQIQQTGPAKANVKENEKPTEETQIKK